MTHFPLKLVFILSFLLFGCASSAPTQFYMLTPLSKSDIEPLGAAFGQDLAIGVGPMELPDYLDRPQIVTQLGPNEYKLAPFDNWSEPLKDNVRDVLAENLALLIPTERIALFPWKRDRQINYQVTVRVIRFDRSVDGDSVLTARWRLLDGDGKAELVVRTKTYTVPPNGPDYSATVAAMNQTLAELSRDIATAIRNVQSGGR